MNKIYTKQKTLFKNKGLLILLSALMVLGTVGCRKPNVRPESTIKVNKTGYPIVDEMTVFDIGIVTNQSEGQIALNDYQIFDELAELTNIKINWVPLPKGNHVTKFVLQLVSGKYPEAFIAYDLELHDTQRLVDQGILVPLEAYVEEGWMPNFSAIIEKDPNLLETLWLNDRFYSLPMQDHGISTSASGIDKGYAPEMLNLNKEWMEALNLEVPNTLDEFYDVLKAFKSGDPNGNGKADEIPLSFVWNSYNYDLTGFWNTFKLVDRKWEHYMVRDGEVINPNIQPEYRDAILFLNKLHDEGLLDIEFVNQDDAMFYSKVKNNQVGAWFSPPLTLFGSNKANADWNRKNVIAVPPFITADGDRWWSKQAGAPYPGFQISNKAKSPEALLRWADALYDEYYGIQTLYGAFGQGLRELEDGTYEVVKQEKNFDVNTITFKHGMPRYLTETTWNRFEKNEWDIYLDEISELFYPHVNYEPFLPTALSRKDGLKMGEIHTDLSKLIHQKQVEWISGTGDINKEWDAYITEMEKIGVYEMLEILQSGLK